MNNNGKPMGFAAAMKDFFGLRVLPDGTKQTLSDFSAEVKALNDEEKAFFKNGLTAQGYNII